MHILSRKLKGQSPKIGLDLDLKFLSQEDSWGRQPGATQAVAAEEGRQMEPTQLRKVSKRGRPF